MRGNNNAKITFIIRHGHYNTQVQEGIFGQLWAFKDDFRVHFLRNVREIDNTLRFPRTILSLLFW